IRRIGFGTACGATGWGSRAARRFGGQSTTGRKVERRSGSVRECCRGRGIRGDRGSRRAGGGSGGRRAGRGSEDRGVRVRSPRRFHRRFRGGRRALGALECPQEFRQPTHVSTSILPYPFVTAQAINCSLLSNPSLSKSVSHCFLTVATLVIL